MTYDGSHSYSYDAEGRIDLVDSGADQYVYDALAHRVRTVVGTTANEFAFNASGQRVAEWSGTSSSPDNTFVQAKYYWGATPVAYYDSTDTYFEHQDWMGTERLRTTYNGGVEGTFTSLPFGDDLTPNPVNSDHDANHYGMLDRDSETETEHAQFRQYQSAQGHWLSLDPYGGSYDISNPQSFNRYAYTLNNPLSLVDPSGLEINMIPCGTAPDGTTLYCIVASETTVTVYAGDDGGINGGIVPLGGSTAGGQNGGGKAPSNGPTPNRCQATLLNMANQQLGTNFNSSNVAGSYMNGTAYNIIIQSNQLTAGQFNNIQQGRYTTSGWQYLTGAGLAGHIADETNLGFAQSAFQSSNIGGNLSVSFAFHDDHGYANNPIGALIHWITDVLGHNTRKPC